MLMFLGNKGDFFGLIDVNKGYLFYLRKFWGKMFRIKKYSVLMGNERENATYSGDQRIVYLFLRVPARILLSSVFLSSVFTKLPIR